MTGQILLNVILIAIILLTAFLTYNKTITFCDDDDFLDVLLSISTVASILILLVQIGCIIYKYWDIPIF